MLRSINKKITLLALIFAINAITFVVPSVSVNALNIKSTGNWNWRDSGTIDYNATDLNRGNVEYTFVGSGNTFTYNDDLCNSQSTLTVGNDKSVGNIEYNKQDWNYATNSYKCGARTTSAITIGNTNAANLGAGTGQSPKDSENNKEGNIQESELTVSEGCARAIPGVGWLFCQIIDLADGVYNFFKSRVQDLLLIDERSFNNRPLYNSWSNVRNIANALVALAALVIIASQIFGFEILSAYAVKKSLPRVLIAVIAIQLSWIGLTSLIALTNAVGVGIHDLLIYPFVIEGSGDITSLYASSSVASGLTTSLLALGGIGLGGAALFAAGGGSFALLLTLLSVLVSILVAMFVLIVRSLVIIILLVLAPVAIAAWVIPGTQNWFKIWWQLFSKLLLMLPLIMILFAAGTIGANILFFSNSTQEGFDDLFTTISILVVYFAPLFLITATFKFAGGLFNRIVNIGDKVKGDEKKFGWFGARDRAEITKQKRAWNMSREQKKSALQRKGDEVYGRRLNQPKQGIRGAYSRGMLRKSGIDDASRARSQASAAATIQQAEEQQYKDQASLSRFYATSIARNKDAWSEYDFRNKTLYDREQIVRDQILKAAAGGQVQVGGLGNVGVKITDDLKAATAIEALRNKDPNNDPKNPDMPDMSQGINQYTNSTEGFRALKDYGTMDRDAWSVLAEKLPTAAKGAPTPGLDNPTVRGFEDAIKNFAKLGKAQQAEVRRGLLTQQGSDPDSVTAILSTFARNTEVTGEQLKAIQGTIGQGLDLNALRSTPTGKLTYTPGTTPGTGTFSIT